MQVLALDLGLPNKEKEKIHETAGQGFSQPTGQKMGDILSE